jgi:1-acyl-sn-glycerol-3-phosphate acyltransferase
MTAPAPATTEATPNAPGSASPPHEPYKRREHTAAYKLTRMIARIATTLLFDLKVYGTRHLPRTGGLLLVSNHQSNLDPVLLGVQLPRALSYMAKSELFKVHPLFTWMIRSLGAFPVRQRTGDVGAVKEAIARLQEGDVLNVYPEGSRTETGEIGPMEKGIGLVIRRAKVPVVPVAIDGSYEAWRKGRRMFRRWPIRLQYGPPMDLAHLKGEEIVQRVDQTLRKMYDDLRSRRGEHPPPFPPSGYLRRGR